MGHKGRRAGRLQGGKNNLHRAPGRLVRKLQALPNFAERQHCCPAAPFAGCRRPGAHNALQDTDIMEAEHINAIGNAIEDLSERTQDLRRYL